MNHELEVAFDKFIVRVRARMEVGAQTYGEASLVRPRIELVDEIMQETEDICGWASILWMRLERLRQSMNRMGDR